MASPNEPNNESVRIDLPLPTAEKSPDPNIKPRETVRIQLPVREPLGKAPVHAPTEPRNPPSFSPLSASVMPAPESPSSGPKKETARIPLVPDPLPSAGQMKNTQSVIMPNVAPRNPSSASAPAEKKPMLLYWILLGVSALILIIQIWTYFS
ncbi:MAG: hypothetical protein DME92_10715 [Verrucomicrobia bacterium]|nr:MAG: hypothetical protein DME92_10715 [Verrucomicrobiota bacterium]